jgi:hypothetical protein
MNKKEACILFIEDVLNRINKGDAEVIDVSINRETRELFLEDLIRKFEPNGVESITIRYKLGAK